MKNSKQKSALSRERIFVLVPVAGLEPARCRHRWILSPLRLPIPSHRHLVYRYDIIRQNAEKSKHFSDKNPAYCRIQPRAIRISCSLDSSTANPFSAQLASGLISMIYLDSKYPAHCVRKLVSHLLLHSQE